jgi:hypothetical protein
MSASANVRQRQKADSLIYRPNCSLNYRAHAHFPVCEQEEYENNLDEIPER